MNDVTAIQKKTVPLGEVATLRRGFDLPSRVRKPGSVPIISSSGIAATHEVAAVSGPGVVTGRYGTIGEVFFVRDDYWPLNTTLYVCEFHSNDERFIYYLLKTVDFSSHSGKSGVPGVNRNDIHKELVWLPPLVEQRLIAGVLTDADDLIDALERLLAKKQAIKQGMMQELLTGKTRIAGDDSLWPNTKLSESTSWYSGGTPSKANPNFWQGEVPWISALSLKEFEVRDSELHVSQDAVRSGSRMAPVDSTLLLVRGSALHNEIRASIVTAPVCFNQDVKAIVPKHPLSPRFLTHWIHGNADRLLRMVTSAGNTAGVLGTKDLMEMELRLPPHNVQLGIMRILDDVIEEIDLLQKRLEKARLIKQGMMQELLTGRTRLPVPEGEA